MKKLQKEIHELAKEKGWWDKPRSPLEIHALIATEVREFIVAIATKERAEEAADIAIRTFDYLQHRGWEVTNSEIQCSVDPLKRKGRSILDDAVEFFQIITCATEMARRDDADGEYIQLVSLLRSVWQWATLRGIALENVIREKHEYNKTRSHRHGGKKF